MTNSKRNVLKESSGGRAQDPTQMEEDREDISTETWRRKKGKRIPGSRNS